MNVYFNKRMYVRTYESKIVENCRKLSKRREVGAQGRGEKVKLSLELAGTKKWGMNNISRTFAL